MRNLFLKDKEKVVAAEGTKETLQSTLVIFINPDLISGSPFSLNESGHSLNLHMTYCILSTQKTDHLI